MGASTSQCDRDISKEEEPNLISPNILTKVESIKTTDKNNNILNKDDKDIDSKSLRFHEVRGKNLIISNKNYSVERSEKSFCDAIAFSNRPICVFERIYVKITKLSSIWNGNIRFGFTSVDPNTMIKSLRESVESDSGSSQSSEYFNYQDEDNDYPYDLPKYVYPNLTNKKGYWAGAMPDGTLKENDILYFYVNSNGEIHYGINNKYIGLFLSGVDVYYNRRIRQLQPLWAIFDVYGNTIAIEFINKNETNNQSYSRLNQIQYHQNNERNTFKTFISSSTTVDNNATTSLGSIISNGSASSSSSGSNSIISNQSSPYFNTSSSSGSSATTVIPNPRFSTNKNNNQAEDDIDRLLISCRRLCVDNHLNETLHNSIIDANDPRQASLKDELRNLRTNEQINQNIQNFYSTIPILIHDGQQQNFSITTAPTLLDNKSQYKFIPKIMGKNVNISQPDCLIAYRESSINQFKDRYLSSVLNQDRTSSDLTALIHSRVSKSGSMQNHQSGPTRNCYVFLDKPIEKGKYFCMQIVGIDQSISESSCSLSIGCTACDPKILEPRIDLPDDSNDLLDRPEYWVVYKNLFNKNNQQNSNVALADELCFKLDERNGNLNFYINGNLITECLFNVDLTQKLWFFFDLCGKTNAIRIIPSCQNNTANNVVMRSTLNPMTNNDTQFTARRRPNSALMNYYKNQLIMASSASQNETISSSSDITVVPSDNQLYVNNTQIKTDKVQPKKIETSKRRSTYEGQEECKICWSAPIECVFYSCGHMCLCWNCATMLKKDSSIKSLSTTVILNDTITNRQSTSTSPTTTNILTKSKNPLCPICRLEIIDIIRFFKS